MKEELTTFNARIKSTMLGLEDHGLLTFFVHLEWNGAGQGLGGYGLDSSAGKDHKDRIGFGPGLIAIRSILEVVGVERWEQLPGQLVRVQAAGWGSHRPPIIGHIIEDRWFDLKAFMDKERAKV